MVKWQHPVLQACLSPRLRSAPLVGGLVLTLMTLPTIIIASRAAIQAVAEAAGWDWRWAWNGTHRSEAVAVLTPA